MKKLLLILILLVVSISYSQKTDSNEISIVNEVENLSDEEIFSKINLVIANIFNSADDVIQLNDKETKKMVIKARAEIGIPNQNVVMFPKVKAYPKYLGYMHDYSLNIACRDGRYKMTINFNNGEIYVNSVGVVAGGWRPSPYPAIMNPSKNHIISQTDIWENKLKETEYMFIGKKKKQKVIDALPIELEKYSDKLTLYAQSVFKLVNDGVVNGVDDDDDDW